MTSRIKGQDELVMSVNVSSLREVETILRTLPQDLSEKALRSAMRQAAKVIGQEARKKAPKKTGNLRKGIVWSGERGKKDPTQISAYVQARAYHAHLVEFGTNERWQKYKKKRSRVPLQKPRYTGSGPAQPYLFPAARAKAQDAANVLAGSIRKYLDKQNKRLAKVRAA